MDDGMTSQISCQVWLKLFGFLVAIRSDTMKQNKNLNLLKFIYIYSYFCCKLNELINPDASSDRGTIEQGNGGGPLYISTMVQSY